MTETIISPRLAELEHELRQGNTDALHAFWKEVHKTGAPLIEEADGDDLYVTFLWEGQDGDDNICFFGGPAGWNLEECKLTRLLDTNLFYRTIQTAPRIAAEYYVSPNDTFGDNFGQRLTNLQGDPLNPHRIDQPDNPDHPHRAEISTSVLRFPGFAPSPIADERADVAKGELTAHRVKSEFLNNERTVWVYTPPDYQSLEACGLLVLFDGLEYQSVIPTPVILDNLLADGEIPPFVTVLVNSNEHRNSELKGDPNFPRFVLEELLPWVREHYRVTDDPAQSIIGGCSNAGLTALWIAYQRPDVFGNVLSQSGNFYEGFDEPEWIVNQLEQADRLPLKISLDIGSFERDKNLLPNRRLHEILQAKGYPVQFIEFKGGHDFICWRETFADGLLFLVREGQ